jgi:cell wall-associated NlpC family hydrolase
MMNRIILPRNAREQIHCGVEVPFDFSEMQAGDLVFFGSLKADGSIASVTHVAMYIGGGRIIHSSQLVRINSLEDGLPDSYGRKPIAVRRILGHVDCGLGAVSAAAAPWYFSK